MIRKIIKFNVLLALVLTSSSAFANYQQAQAAFRAGDYVKAAAAYFQARSLYRDKAEQRNAEWGLAQSLQKLNLFYSASKYYSIIVRRGFNRGNPWFRNALEELGKINGSISLGQSHIVQLFRTRIDPLAIPQSAKGFYFYYLGIEQFILGKYEKASTHFRRVPPSSPYSLGARFHLGVILNISGQHSKAIEQFDRVRSLAGNSRRNADIKNLTLMNIARVEFERKNFRQSLQYYSQVDRDSVPYWLDAHFEGAWSFFWMQKHNNTLGNIHTIHSPFYENRFYPEAYILQAITFLKLCRYNEVRTSIKSFRERYKDTFRDTRALLASYGGKPKDFFGLVYEYRTGTLNRYRKSFEILDKISRSSAYVEASDTIRFASRELSRLGGFGGVWQSSGLLDELRQFLKSKQKAASVDAGRRLYREARQQFDYLKEMAGQSDLIQAEMLLGKVNTLRKKLNVRSAKDKTEFNGGMSELKLGEVLEYWPFLRNEYWEDELGHYKYNIDSRCGEKE